jgi:carboxymethylenebutenolidase
MNRKTSKGRNRDPAERVSRVADPADIGCPILFHFGEEDENPSPGDRIKLDTEPTRLGKEHEFHAYPSAAHAFMNFSNAERYREAAAEAFWPRTLAFLERRLRG